jgi:2-dehydropantoate 2-reductase
MKTSSILIIGTGALATLFAARLSAAGVDVIMLGTWQAGLDALRKEGARLVGSDGLERVYPVRATDDPVECREARLALVLVKGWQTERAARQLYTCLDEEGLALTLQNGLGNREILAGLLGFWRVALGVTTIGATLLAPGLARLGGDGPVSIEAHPRLGPLEAILRTAGFAVSVVADARSLVWGKLVISAAINPLTAFLRVPNGELLHRPAARLLMGELAHEAAAVARALGVSLPFEVPESAVEEVARRTSANHSSMLQDVLRGAPTEIDAICGAIVRAGEERGVPTPVNRAMWHLVKALAE